MPRITPIHYRRLARIFELAGFRWTREKGDHLVYTRPDCPRPVVIPKWEEVPVFVIKNNLRTAQMSREEYFEFLSQT